MTVSDLHFELNQFCDVGQQWPYYELRDTMYQMVPLYAYIELYLWSAFKITKCSIQFNLDWLWIFHALLGMNDCTWLNVLPALGAVHWQRLMEQKIGNHRLHANCMCQVNQIAWIEFNWESKHIGGVLWRNHGMSHGLIYTMSCQERTHTLQPEITANRRPRSCWGWGSCLNDIMTKFIYVAEYWEIIVEAAWTYCSAVLWYSPMSTPDGASAWYSILVNMVQSLVKDWPLTRWCCEQ